MSVCMGGCRMDDCFWAFKEWNGHRYHGRLVAVCYLLSWQHWLDVIFVRVVMLLHLGNVF
jgi:hypothetical protein